MYSGRALVIIIRPSHVTLTLTLVNHKDDLGRDLGAQKARLFEPCFLPFWKVLWRLDGFDRCGCLTMRRVRAMVHACHTGHDWIAAVGHHVLRLCSRGGVKKRIDLRGAAAMRAELGLRCVCTGSSRRGDV